MTRPDRRHSTRVLLSVVVALTSGWFAAQAAEKQLEFHGFLSQGFLYSSDNNYLTRTSDGSFEFNEAGLNIGTDLSDSLRLGVQFFMRDLGELGNHEVELDWAYADYRHRDWFGLRAGKFKMPYGLYNETADVDAVRTSVLLPQSVYPLTLRDLLISVTGVNAYGNVPLGGGGSLDYQVYAGNTNVSNDGSVARFFNDSGAFTVRRIETDPIWGGAWVWNAPLDGLRLGMTTTNYDGRIQVDVAPALQSQGLPPQTTLETDSTYFRVYSGEYVVGNWAFTAEYARWIGDFRNAFFPVRLNDERYYGLASYRINDRFEVGAYYSQTFPDKDDKDGDNATPSYSAWQKDLAVSLRVDLSWNWILKFEAHDVDGTASLLDQENPDGTERDWQYYAVKLSYAF